MRPLSRRWCRGGPGSQLLGRVDHRLDTGAVVTFDLDPVAVVHRGRRPTSRHGCRPGRSPPLRPAGRAGRSRTAVVFVELTQQSRSRVSAIRRPVELRLAHQPAWQAGCPSASCTSVSSWRYRSFFSFDRIASRNLLIRLASRDTAAKPPTTLPAISSLPHSGSAVPNRSQAPQTPPPTMKIRPIRVQCEVPCECSPLPSVWPARRMRTRATMRNAEATTLITATAIPILYLSQLSTRKQPLW